VERKDLRKSTDPQHFSELKRRHTSDVHLNAALFRFRIDMVDMVGVHGGELQEGGRPVQVGVNALQTSLA
jgi:hypothetical protein